MKALSFFIQFQGDSFNHRLHIIGCKRILQELKQQGKFIFSLRFCDQFDLYISNVILGEMFLAKYPVYSCKIKKLKDHISQKSCGCC